MPTLNPVDSQLLEGFGERISFNSLRAGKMSDIPDDAQGVYAVVCPFDGPPVFLAHGSCGDFRGAPYPLTQLEEWWVPQSRVLYFGKAGGPGIAEKLYDRVQKYSSFGLGKNVPHGGGRAIWQIEHSELLDVCWKATPDRVPRHVEIEFVDRFRKAYAKRPFANRRD